MPRTAAQEPLVLPTAVCGYVLRQLGPCDEAAYWRLVDASRRHLGRHGDYTYLRSATPEWARAALVTEREGHLRLLGWLGPEAVGRFDLIAREPGQFVVAYWLAQAFTGCGPCHGRVCGPSVPREDPSRGNGRLGRRDQGQHAQRRRAQPPRVRPGGGHGPLRPLPSRPDGTPTLRLGSARRRLVGW
jgi:hypothetical protein